MNRDPDSSVRKHLIDIEFYDFSAVGVPKLGTEAVHSESNGKILRGTAVVGQEIDLGSVDITMDEVYRSILGEGIFHIGNDTDRVKGFLGVESSEDTASSDLFHSSPFDSAPEFLDEGCELTEFRV